jgi:hypothetical protein
MGCIAVGAIWLWRRVALVQPSTDRTSDRQRRRSARHWSALERSAHLRQSPILRDYTVLGQRLIHVLDRALPATLLDTASSEAQSVLLARVACDLRTVLTTAESGYPLQALTLASSLFEHAHVATAVGTNDEMALRWRTWDNEWRAFPGQKTTDVLKRAVSQIPRNIIPADQIDAHVARLQTISTKFGGGKHGLPSLQRAAHIAHVNPDAIRLGPWPDAAAAIVGRVAIAYAIEVAHTATIHYVGKRSSPELARPLLDELISIGDQLQSLDRRFRGDWARITAANAGPSTREARKTRASATDSGGPEKSTR